jgi:hypothetical protein
MLMATRQAQPNAHTVIGTGVHLILTAASLTAQVSIHSPPSRPSAQLEEAGATS